VVLLWISFVLVPEGKLCGSRGKTVPQFWGACKPDTIFFFFFFKQFLYHASHFPFFL